MTKESIGRALARLAAEQPDRPALTCAGQTVTRAELESRTNRLARAYAGLGVREGSFVTIAFRNSIAFYEATIAAWKLGAIPQPVSAGLPLRERAAIVELADSGLVVGVGATDHPGRRCLVADFVPDPTLGDTPLPDAVSPAWKAPTSGGSTGRPKLIVSGDPGLVDHGLPVRLGMRPDGCQLVCGPLYHNGPFTTSSLGLLLGNHQVVMPRFDAEEALTLMVRHRVDWLLLVPTMMHRIWRLPEQTRSAADLCALQAVLHLAAPCPVWLKEAWLGWLGPERILEVYAGTEAQTITLIDGREWLAHRGSVGRPITGEIQIVAEDGRPAAAEEIGEIFMRPSQGRQTYRYIGSSARCRGDWESLGDLGYLDKEGYLYLVDRRTDLILSGGANIYPAEVEAAIDEHPAAMDSVVVGVPDDDLGQRAHAFVQTRGDLDTEVLNAFLAERLVRYKLPRSYTFVAESLRDEVGKVRRSQLAERARQSLEESQAADGS